VKMLGLKSKPLAADKSDKIVDINALIITGSDPGAVPGDSTKIRSFGG